MEELTLTDPVVIPQKTTAKYHVVSLTLSTDQAAAVAGPPGLILITLRNEHDEASNYSYTGDAAIAMIKQLNTANLTTKSMHKRILEKLSADGLLPGTVTGTPDP
jgi:hypothetical protein